MRRLLALIILVSPVAATDYFLTVAGLGGEADYEQRFTAWAKDLAKILGDSPNAKVETLLGGGATRQRLHAVLGQIASEAKPEDTLVLMLIGHGSFDGVDYKINIPGPDATAAEIASLLERVPARRQLVVNMSSASGGSLPFLQKEGRAVITATKSGTERNATVFARYWVEALRDPTADTDKNETISALEAFRYAAQKTARFYESQKRLATEHALLEDTGKGEGVREPSEENGRGFLAARFPLVRLSEARLVARDPAKRKLLARVEELEQKIDLLKYQKAALPTGEYKKQLTSLLLELARTQAELDKE